MVFRKKNSAEKNINFLPCEKDPHLFPVGSDLETKKKFLQTWRNIALMKTRKHGKKTCLRIFGKPCYLLRRLPGLHSPLPPLLLRRRPQEQPLQRGLPHPTADRGGRGLAVQGRGRGAGGLRKKWEISWIKQKKSFKKVFFAFWSTDNLPRVKKLTNFFFKKKITMKAAATTTILLAPIIVSLALPKPEQDRGALYTQLEN